MIIRPTSRALLQQSVEELLDQRTIEDITVTQIARNCSMTARAFYYHFRDKHDVVSSIYLDAMRPHVDCPLDEWYTYMNDFFLEHPSLLAHALTYMGQNCLADAIQGLEWEKLRLHIKPSVKKSKELYNRTLVGIEYMLHGNLGLLRSSHVSKISYIASPEMYACYKNLWDLLTANMPTAVLENLSMHPVSDGTGEREEEAEDGLLRESSPAGTMGRSTT